MQSLSFDELQTLGAGCCVIQYSSITDAQSSRRVNIKILGATRKTKIPLHTYNSRKPIIPERNARELLPFPPHLNALSSSASENREGRISSSVVFRFSYLTSQLFESNRLKVFQVHRATATPFLSPSCRRVVNAYS